MKTLLILLLLVATIGLVSAQPDFQVDIQGTPLDADAGKPYDVQVRACNAGDAGEMKVETGIYTQDVLKDWYNTNTLSIFPVYADDYLVPNCPGSGTNVQTAAITLQAGECTDINFEVTAPNDHNLNYAVHSAAFERCYADSPGDTGQTSYDIEVVDVTYSIGVTATATCSDGIRNQDETDTDCGGSCNSCPDYYECRFDSDCQASSYCVNNQATGELICAPGDSALIPDLDEPLPETSETTPSKTDEELTADNRAPNDEPNRAVTSENEVVAPKTGSKWLTIPVVDKRNVGNGEEITVTATFYADADGDFLLEAGMGKFKDLPLSVAISENSCDPGTPEFANEKVSLKRGENEITFTIGARDDGDYKFWVAYVNECGGTTLHQVEGDGLVAVGVRGDNVGEKFELGAIIGATTAAIILAVLGGILLFFGLMKK